MRISRQQLFRGLLIAGAGATPSDHLSLLKKAGLVLVVIGLLDVGVMIYSIASKTSYSSRWRQGK